MQTNVPAGSAGMKERMVCHSPSSTLIPLGHEGELEEEAYETAEGLKEKRQGKDPKQQAEGGTVNA